MCWSLASIIVREVVNKKIQVLFTIVEDMLDKSCQKISNKSASVALSEMQVHMPKMKTFFNFA